MTRTADNAKTKLALLLAGGGARAAYQVGVLKALAEIIPEETTNPFEILCGTSAGSINATVLAANARDFHTDGLQPPGLQIASPEKSPLLSENATPPRSVRVQTSRSQDY